MYNITIVTAFKNLCLYLFCGEKEFLDKFVSSPPRNTAAKHKILAKWEAFLPFLYFFLFFFYDFETKMPHSHLFS